MSLKALGGQSFVVKRGGGKGKIRRIETSDSVSEDSIHMTFEDWVKTASWADNEKLMKELLPFVEMDHPIPLKPPIHTESDMAFTDADCREGGKFNSTIEVFSGSRPSGQVAFAMDVS